MSNFKIGDTVKIINDHNLWNANVDFLEKEEVFEDEVESYIPNKYTIKEINSIKDIPYLILHHSDGRCAGVVWNPECFELIKRRVIDTFFG